jgi:integrase
LRSEPPRQPRSRRTVPLPDQVLEFLSHHWVAQSERRLHCGPAWSDHDLAFDRGDGRAIHPSVVSRYFARLMDRHGTPRVRFHDLRHAFATELFSRGVSLKDVSAALGHSSETFTLSVYINYLPRGCSRCRAIGHLRRFLLTSFRFVPHLSQPSKGSAPRGGAWRVLAGGGGGAGWTRTSDRRIMSPLL